MAAKWRSAGWSPARRGPTTRRGGFFNQVSPARSVFQGGPGAWEFVGRFSYIDLDSGDPRRQFLAVHADGQLAPLRPARLEVAYGYGSLDRFDVVGRRTSSRRACSCSSESDDPPVSHASAIRAGDQAAQPRPVDAIHRPSWRFEPAAGVSDEGAGGSPPRSRNRVRFDRR